MNPPGRNTIRDWAKFDEAIMVLIDNPGKWGIVETRANLKDRTLNHLRARVGNGFLFKTHVEGGAVNVWGCYHPKEAQ